MSDRFYALYTDLLKRTLIDWGSINQPASNAAPVSWKPNPKLKDRALRVLDGWLRPLGGAVVLLDTQTQADRREARLGGRDWPPHAKTMIGRKRLDNLQFALETVVREGIPGDFVETGVWRGGASLFARLVLDALDAADRKTWLCDSFEGLPPPRADEFPEDAADQHYTFGNLAVSEEEVRTTFALYDAEIDDRVAFVKGFFKDTLADLPVESISVLRLDGDMYESTIQALRPLYPKVPSGGFVIIDDYFLPPCAKAVHDYLEEIGEKVDPVDIDGVGRYFRKP